MATTITSQSDGQTKPRQGFVSTFFRSPQKTFLRKAMFQVHLWTGVLLSIYIALIGISGSITVFRLDIVENIPSALQHRPLDAKQYKSLDEIAATIQAAVPQGKVASILAPDEDKHAYASLVKTRDDMKFVVVDPYTAKLIRVVSFKKHWAAMVGEFHENLLMGETGEFISGWASILLLLTLLTGLVLWWPGVARWVRALGINFKANWKRINFDTHNAIGLWTLLLTSMWCITTVVMVWPEKSNVVMSHISPVTDATVEPKFVLPKHPNGCPKYTLQSIVDAATAAQPQTQFATYSRIPAPNQPIRVFMARGKIYNRGEWDEQIFDPCDGKLLVVWKRWIWKSGGDAIITGSRPLHVGFVWGRWAQWVWFIFGLSFPILAITGVLMYWNRYLSKRWRALRG
jgi:uncharacterized iron-regulated membrane protein